jgi:hypothetical protein
MLNAPLDAEMPVPAMAVAKSAMLSFFELLESFASMKPKESAATSIVPADKEFKSPAMVSPFCNILLEP